MDMREYVEDGRREGTTSRWAACMEKGRGGFLGGLIEDVQGG